LFFSMIEIDRAYIKFLTNKYRKNKKESYWQGFVGDRVEFTAIIRLKIKVLKLSLQEFKLLFA
jgi:hypothetical protein